MPTVHYVSRDFLKQLGVSNPPRTPRQIKTHLRRDPDYFKRPLGGGDKKERPTRDSCSSESSRAICKHGSTSESIVRTSDGHDVSTNCDIDGSIGTFSLGDAASDQNKSVPPSSITVVEGDTTMPKTAASDCQRARTGTLTLPAKTKPSTSEQQVGQVPAPLANSNKKKGPRLFKCPRSQISDPPKKLSGREPNDTITDEGDILIGAADSAGATPTHPANNHATSDKCSTISSIATGTAPTTSSVPRVLIPPMASNPTCVPVEEPSQVLAGLCATDIKVVIRLNVSKPIIEDHEGIKQCVMCGEMCTYRRKDTNRAYIPKCNKGVCNACDGRVWHHRPSGHYIKFCKGCKNFLSWPNSFGKSDAMKSKCSDCRERARERYRLKQHEEKADAGAKMTPPASSEESADNVPVHKSPAKSDNEPCAVKAGEVDTILPRNGEPSDEASSHADCPISADHYRTVLPDSCDQAFELESDSEAVESVSTSDPLPFTSPVKTPNSAHQEFEKALSAESKEIGGRAPVNHTNLVKPDHVPNSLNDCPDEIDGILSAKEKPSSSHVPPPMIYPVAYPPPHYFYPLPQPPGIYHPSFPPPSMPGNYFHQPYYPRSGQDDDAKAAAAAAMMGLGQRPSLAAPANQPVYLTPGMPSPYEACPQPHIAPENAEES